MTRVANWVIESSSTTGTGSITLAGAVSPDFSRFKSAFSSGPVYYTIKDGVNREAGIGTFNGIDNIARTNVMSTLINGVYNDTTPSPINLQSGAAIVACTLNAAAFNAFLLTSVFNTHVDGSDTLLRHKASDVTQLVTTNGFGPDVQQGLDGSFALANTKIRFRQSWISQQYLINDMVQDGNWLGVATVDTTDRPAPQPIGAPLYTYPNAPNWDAAVANLSVVECIHDYSISKSGWLNKLRVWSVTGSILNNNSRIYIYDVTNPITPLLVNQINNPTLVADDWSYLPFPNKLVNAGTKYKIIFMQYNAAVGVTIVGPWVLGSHSTAAAPLAGQWNANSTSISLVSVVRINKTDNNGSDRSSELVGIVADSTIKFTQDNDPTLASIFNVSNPLVLTDNGTYYTIDVDSGVSGSIGIVADGALSTANILPAVVVDTDYRETLNYWVAQPSFASVVASLNFNGIDQPGNALTGYGIDIEFQEAIISPDWFLLSTIGDGSGGTMFKHPGLDDNATKVVITLEDASTRIDNTLIANDYSFKPKKISDILNAGDSGDLDRFGESCSLSGNGQVLAVGAVDWDHTDPNTGTVTISEGAVYIYDWNGSGWIQRGPVIVPSLITAGLRFGRSCCLSNDGSLLAVGVEAINSVYTFNWNGSIWVEGTQVITPAVVVIGAKFGSSCSLDFYGLRLAIGSKEYAPIDGTSGAVYIFDWNGANWIENSQIIQSSNSLVYELFGDSCSFGLINSVLVVGASLADASVVDEGVIYTFDLSGGVYVERPQILSASNPAVNDGLGVSCWISQDATVLVAGAPHTSGPNSEAFAGALITFDFINGLWVERPDKLFSPIVGAVDYFGLSCSISYDGAIISIGSPLLGPTLTEYGAVQTFALNRTEPLGSIVSNGSGVLSEPSNITSRVRGIDRYEVNTTEVVVYGVGNPTINDNAIIKYNVKSKGQRTDVGVFTALGGEFSNYYAIANEAGISKFVVGLVGGISNRVGLGPGNTAPTAVLHVKTDDISAVFETISANIDITHTMRELGVTQWTHSYNFADSSNRYGIYDANGSEVISYFQGGIVSIANPSTVGWDLTYDVLQVGSIASISTSSGGFDTSVMNNAYWDGTDFRYIVTGVASEFRQVNGWHSFRTAISGTAGSIITWIISSVTRPGGGVQVTNYTTAQRNSIVNMVAGEQIYNTTTNTLNYWDGINWMQVTATIAP